MMLQAEKIAKAYGEFRALDGVTLGIEAGEFVSVIGPNGAGKSTLINVLTGLLKPTAGRVYLKGQDITGVGPGRLACLGMARSFQLVTIFPGLTVLEVLQVAVTARLRRGSRLLASLARDREVTAQATEVAELFLLSEKLGMVARQLPQGDKKLLDVASAFALHPEVILLDEPTSGVSTQEKHKVMAILVAAAKRMGIRSILQVEHDMDIVFGYSDRIIALHQGRILADGTPQALQENADVMRLVVGHQGRPPGFGRSA
jgi:branched-chain amino acid transport system ATP-binding protein